MLCPANRGELRLQPKTAPGAVVRTPVPLPHPWLVLSPQLHSVRSGTGILSVCHHEPPWKRLFPVLGCALSVPSDCLRGQGTAT